MSRPRDTRDRSLKPAPRPKDAVLMFNKIRKGNGFVPFRYNLNQILSGFLSALDGSWSFRLSTNEVSAFNIALATW